MTPEDYQQETESRIWQEERAPEEYIEYRKTVED